MFSTEEHILGQSCGLTASFRTIMTLRGVNPFHFPTVVFYQHNVCNNAGGRKTAVQAAIDIYNKYTCIRIVPKNSSHRDYITIYDGGAGV